MEKQVKIHGIYPGYGKVPKDDEILIATDVFMEIVDYDNRINNTYEITGINADETDLEELIYTLDYYIYYTRFYGAEFPPPQEGKRIEITESFMEWYKIYFDAYRSIMKKYPHNTKENTRLISLKYRKK